MRWRPAHPWFGPKRYGFGWRPISREGWLVSLAYLVLIGVVCALGAYHVLRGGPIAALVAILSVGLLIVCALTGGVPRRTGH